MAGEQLYAGLTDCRSGYEFFVNRSVYVAIAGPEDANFTARLDIDAPGVPLK